MQLSLPTEGDTIHSGFVKQLEVTVINRAYRVAFYRHPSQL